MRLVVNDKTVKGLITITGRKSSVVLALQWEDAVAAKNLIWSLRKDVSVIEWIWWFETLLISYLYLHILLHPIIWIDWHYPNTYQSYNIDMLTSGVLSQVFIITYECSTTSQPFSTLACSPFVNSDRGYMQFVSLSSSYLCITVWSARFVVQLESKIHRHSSFDDNIWYLVSNCKYHYHDVCFNSQVLAVVAVYCSTVNSSISF